MITPEQLQVLKQKQRILWDTGFDKFIKHIRCQKQLCKDIKDEERQERKEAIEKSMNQISDIEITIQTLKELDER